MGIDAAIVMISGHGDIDTAVATAVTAMEITTKRTLPKECTQLVLCYDIVVEPSEELET